jgi:large subunit ribosomal protein L21
MKKCKDELTIAVGIKKTFGAKGKRSIFAVLLRKIINMYAIVEIAGHQYKVQKDQQIYVNRLQDAEGSKVTFDKVLLTDDGKKVTVGAPAVEGVKITASVVQHLKGDKVIVFKKKRRKGYQKKNGFRAYLTELKIEKIG